MDTVNLAVADAMSRDVDELTRLHQLLHQEPHVRGLGRVVIFTVIPIPPTVIPTPPTVTPAPPTVIPAQAGIYACRLHYRSRRLRRWIPAQAGMTVVGASQC